MTFEAVVDSLCSVPSASATADDEQSAALSRPVGSQRDGAPRSSGGRADAGPFPGPPSYPNTPRPGAEGLSTPLQDHAQTRANARWNNVLCERRR